jgi:hypothetical protein
MLGCMLLGMLGCESTPDPQKIGVFASTNHGLMELTTYGEQNGMTSFELRKLHVVPKAAKVTQFYVNMPDSTITELKIFWVTKLSDEFDEKDQSPLNVSIETGKNNVYRIKCADLMGKTNGFALVKLSMPMGVSDRVYVIQITE